MDDTTAAGPETAGEQLPASSSSSAPPPPAPMAEHNPPASSRELEEIRATHAGELAAHRRTISRLEATADMLVGIVDNLVRHKGAIHDASHLDALELMLEEQRANRPESAQLFAGARAELARRTAEANARR